MEMRACWASISASRPTKCIACYRCSRYGQVGILVMQFAMKRDAFGNWNSNCIGCGICVTACPMDTLSFRGDVTGSHEEETE